MRRLRSEWRRDDWILILLAGFVVLMLAISLLSFARLVIDSLQPIDRKTTDFLTAMREDDYETAFAMLSADLKNTLGIPQRLRGLILEQDASPDTWEYDTHRITDDVQGEIGGWIRQQNGERHRLMVLFVKVDDEWYISRFEWGQVVSPIRD